jgi:hypothetical protein
MSTNQQLLESYKDGKLRRANEVSTATQAARDMNRDAEQKNRGAISSLSTLWKPVFGNSPTFRTSILCPPTICHKAEQA